MSGIEELHTLMAELLDGNVTATPDTLTVTDRGFEIINEISDYAEQTQIFREHKDRGEIFEDATAPEVFGYMLNRIVNAPTTIHMNASVLLIMPFLRRKIQEE